jgi:hypothetical protein
MLYPAGSIRAYLLVLVYCAFHARGLAADETDPMPRMMMGALGSYPGSREASGTAWEPDSSLHAGVHVMQGPWMFMGHALLDGVDDWQGGPRGASESFVAGMVMGMATRHFESGDTLQFRTMESPEPLMGKSGYPLLLATGETADGSTPLVDRQHPHNLFMENAASYSHALSAADSVFLYAGLPGEPALGPPAFMHRQSILDSPEAPITHHWLDSTHITDGVVTAGYVHDEWKLEGSRFHGREPDQFRYEIESGSLDSTSVRASWNPAEEWALQWSWGHLVSPEQLEPAKNQDRLTASAIYTRRLGERTWWSTTVAWGRRRSTGDAALNAYAVESALKPSPPWTLFARVEHEQNNELINAGPARGVEYTVGKISVGAIRDVRVTEALVIGVGALYAFNFVPEPLGILYGGADPKGAMAFVRIKID